MLFAFVKCFLCDFVRFTSYSLYEFSLILSDEVFFFFTPSLKLCISTLNFLERLFFAHLIANFAIF